MEADRALLIVKLLFLFIILDIFANVMSLTNPLLSTSCGALNLAACYPPPPTGVPTFSGLSLTTTKSVLLTPVWASAYVVDTFGLVSSIIFGGYSLNFGVVDVLVNAAIGILLLVLIFLSLPLLIEFAKAVTTIVQGFLELVAGFFVALGASSVSLVGAVAFVGAAVGISVLFGLVI